MQAELETDRLQLRRLHLNDAKFVFGVIGSSTVRKFLGGPVPADQRQATFERYAEQTPDRCSWCVRQQDIAVGLVLVAPHHDVELPEISFMFAETAQGKGYANEAVGAVINCMGRPVVSETQAANQKAIRLLAALGFRQIDTFERFGHPQTLWQHP